MAEKRKRDTDDSSASSKKPKKGFSVGPANLPDGTYKRRVQKIKKTLIEKAKIKKDYAKVKKRDAQLGTAQSTTPNNDGDAQDGESKPVAEPASLELHPDRQTMLDQDEEPEEPARQNSEYRRQRRQKTNPYTKQLERAERLKAEAEERKNEREAAFAERDRKREERERWRRQMAKAKRPGLDGKRKLGRESKLLLERVQRLVNDGDT